MKRLLTLLCLFALEIGSLAGCDDGPESLEPVPEAASEILTGTGVVIAGLPLNLGDTLAVIESNLGPAGAVRDLGELGIQIDYPHLNAGGILSGAEDEATLVRITVYPGFVGVTSDGIGLGSSESEVDAAFGAADTDPFLEASWYTDVGVAVEWYGGQAERIHLFEPGSAW